MKRFDKNIMALSAVCSLAVAVMLLALGFGNREPVFTPPPFETAAVPGEPDQSGYQVLDAQVFRVGLCGEVCTDTDGADVWFSNPADNEVWLKLRVMDEQGDVIGETGILRPNEYVRHVKLSPVPEARASLVLKVMAYEPESYHGAGALTLNVVVAPALPE